MNTQPVVKLLLYLSRVTLTEMKITDYKIYLKFIFTWAQNNSVKKSNKKQNIKRKQRSPLFEMTLDITSNVSYGPSSTSTASFHRPFLTHLKLFLVKNNSEMQQYRRVGNWTLWSSYALQELSVVIKGAISVKYEVIFWRTLPSVLSRSRQKTFDPLGWLLNWRFQLPGKLQVNMFLFRVCGTRKKYNKQRNSVSCENAI